MTWYFSSFRGLGASPAIDADGNIKYPSDNLTADIKKATHILPYKAGRGVHVAEFKGMQLTKFDPNYCPPGMMCTMEYKSAPTTYQWRKGSSQDMPFHTSLFSKKFNSKSAAMDAAKKAYEHYEISQKEPEVASPEPLPGENGKTQPPPSQQPVQSRPEVQKQGVSPLLLAGGAAVAAFLLLR